MKKRQNASLTEELFSFHCEKGTNNSFGIYDKDPGCTRVTYLFKAGMFNSPCQVFEVTLFKLEFGVLSKDYYPLWRMYIVFYLLPVMCSKLTDLMLIQHVLYHKGGEE